MTFDEAINKVILANDNLKSSEDKVEIFDYNLAKIIVEANNYSFYDYNGNIILEEFPHDNISYIYVCDKNYDVIGEIGYKYNGMIIPEW